MIRKPFLAVTYTLLCLSSLFFSSSVTCVTSTSSLPSTFYVTYQGYIQNYFSTSNETVSLWVQFLNGTSCGPKTMNFTFSMEETYENEYIVKFMLEFDNFYDEISVPATVSNGHVYIDSTPTIFVVNPNSLIDGNTIELFQTENLTLSGTVFRDIKTDTLLNNYRVASKVVITEYEPTNLDPYTGPLLFFDPLTGVLVRASDKITDVLLNKLGVDFIRGGVFDLLDYSENMNFTLVRSYSSLVGPILIIIFIVAFVLVVFFAYRALKKKKRDKRKTYTNKSLKFRFVRYQNMRCLYVL
jgi:cbb3-type cytochrome oxidase subunit 3